MNDDVYFKKLKLKIHAFVLLTYNITNDFPRSELYGTVSQLRRAAVSVMLNLVEGFGRRKEKVKLNFFEISYGSARECKYLIFLALEKKWIDKQAYEKIFVLLDEISAMLWSMIVGLEKNIEE
ncbi:MAG: S23 ribosomal protein [Candidatus Magasanikbacteria bacterium GW2011_GWC2_37_14]|uniref:S23 ribosomal protein n=1 Tax=Candidatus Magasanikbacteria bacterium GW2011_GWC2_37_14 TaxID=1619046 RepID=A0A0G0GN09_9BACT|nr:MAG: S23 ribosomal protein [Candidatus Magasanikbacteria bacterium GW2011_GWC2_37_14]